ncbi:Do family serine endopeptidase [Phaeodactylibacter luteus]|uniref:Do family serine endopeptidase n=1 Tax=Phaeodactylibacter luteus TaxID=1564516 RepID=A0A5C6RHJ1_9BACT|nr:Do family serine endopeptidase [Phaeodactylibacter luteus]TXB61801.1 Do family serine endopeptidase [Phaeodactylibacter luteus]
MKQYLAILISSLLSAALAIAAYRYFEPHREVVIRETVSARYTNFDPMDVSKQRSFLSSAPTDFSAAADRVIPAVVNIKTVQSSGNFDLWGSPAVGSASGSGVIISEDGYIVTNNHVIEDSDEIEVTLNDKREYEAELIGTDPSTDLALIKIKAQGLPALEFGNSDSLRVGEWVLAIGNPFNLESTVTSGIVSAKGRSIDILEGQDRIESFIQTDAAVNPGNSGGALANTNGELIGINTAIITRSGRYEGYSFAVPINLVRKVVRDLRDYGVVQRGILGVFIDEMTNELAKKLGLENVEGVYINRVTPGSGADDAGLEKGDVIIGINGVKTKTLPEMQEQLGRYRPGNAIQVEIIRDKARTVKEVVLKNKSNSTALVTSQNADILLELGFEVRELSRQESRRLKAEGVKVISIYRGSRIERTNMDPGFVITKVDNRAVNSVDELVALLEQSSGKVMLEGIYEGYAGEYYYAFPVD